MLRRKKQDDDGLEFDDPASIESGLLAQHVAALARGELIERPLYDFSTHTRVLDRTEPVRAESFVLVEGLFALYYPELLPLYQFRVYVDTPDDICFQRRMKRDTVERGRTPESVSCSTREPCGRRASAMCAPPRQMRI